MAEQDHGEVSAGRDLNITASGGAFAAGSVHGDVNIQSEHSPHWPVRVGVIPRIAAHHQHRELSEQLDAAMDEFGTVMLCQVLSGTGGVGKTQLAAEKARALRDSTDLLIWADAATREGVVFAYAQAAKQLFARVHDDPEQASAQFLAWLHEPVHVGNRGWLVVWDNLDEPSELDGLWPPDDQSCGRTLITTRRRDHELRARGRQLISVDVYTERESHDFLSRALTEAGTPHTDDELHFLAADLGHLPLALGQAVAYMTELRMGCAEYRELFNDRMSTLAEVFPDWDSRLPLAATWDLSLERAETMGPAEVVRALMVVISLLDPEGIPESVLFTMGGEQPNGVRRGLAALVRLSLISWDDGLVVSHRLVQRSSREATPPTPEAAEATARMIGAAWVAGERDTALARKFRRNISVLCSRTVNGESVEQWLWDKGCQPLFLHMLNSLAGEGQFKQATSYGKHFTKISQERVGAGHPQTLILRGRTARYTCQNGDLDEAIPELEAALSGLTRKLGPDHEETLDIRRSIGYCLGSGGELNQALREYEKVFQSYSQKFGAKDHRTLLMLETIATLQSSTGDYAGASTVFKETFSETRHTLGPEDPNTLRARIGAATMRFLSGGGTEAVHDLGEALREQQRVLGADDPNTFLTRNLYAIGLVVTKQFGEAHRVLNDLHRDQVRTLGREHHYTKMTVRSLDQLQYEARKSSAPQDE